MARHSAARRGAARRGMAHRRLNLNIQPEISKSGFLAAFLCGNSGPDRAGWILPGESSTTAAPILKTVDFCVEIWRSAEVGYSGLDIQVKPALGSAALHSTLGVYQSRFLYPYRQLKNFRTNPGGLY